MMLGEVISNGELTEEKMKGIDGHWCQWTHDSQEKMKEMELVSPGQGLKNDFSTANETEKVNPLWFLFMV